MQKLFNKILVPVDFTDRSKKAVEKAGQMASQYDCSIHLLHVINIFPDTALSKFEPLVPIPNWLGIDNKKELEFQLATLCESVAGNQGKAIDIQYAIVKGSWDEAIIEFANQHTIDLIVVGQTGREIRKRKMILDPDKIADKTNSPVITVPSNQKVTGLYSIVIPVTDFLPVRKLMYGVYIASNHNSTIKLLGIENTDTKNKVMYYMMKAYKLIIENCNVKVEFEKTESLNVADAMTRYMQNKAVDLIILNPGTQTKIPGLLSSLLGNIIQKNATPPVLTVNPL